jgi:hypothetical protein
MKTILFLLVIILASCSKIEQTTPTAISGKTPIELVTDSTTDNGHERE